MEMKNGTDAKLQSESNSASATSTIMSPSDNLEKFLPWACEKLGIRLHLTFTIKLQVEYVSSGTKEKVTHKNKKEDISDNNKTDSSESVEEPFGDGGIGRELPHAHIILTYHANDLVHILMKNNKHVPRELIAIIARVAQFHPNLQYITINSGLDQYSMYELSKLLPVSNITEVYLDDTFIKEANYDVLLNGNNQLQVLSLARCRIGDKVVKNIAAKLHYPSPASTTLSALILSSNYLTNHSCQYIAEALRSNRKLCFLNLACNMISDQGGEAILKIFLQFPLSMQETTAYRQRYFTYLKNKQNLLETYLGDGNASFIKNIGKSNKKGAAINNETIKSEANKLVQKSIGEFTDPVVDSINVDGIKYSLGNNTLVYLNMTHNNLSYSFLKLLAKVVQYQSSTGKKGKGLLNVRLEGNPLPVNCTEYTYLDECLESSAFGHDLMLKRKAAVKK